MPRATPHLLRRRTAALCLALCVLGIGLPAQALNGRDVRGETVGGEFRLKDHTGRMRRLADFRGKAVVMFFGYTHCPDVCPTTLSRMNDVMQLLGPDAGRLQVLWVTVDPERDTQALLSHYVPAFHPSFIGLRGTPAQTDAVTRAYQVSYEVVHYHGEVLVDHSSFGYLIDPNGRAVERIGYDLPARKIAEDVREVLGIR